MLNEVGIVHYVLGFVLGHLCGSVPSGLWLVQALHGIDIRNYGSKNIGTTNVFRTVGPTTAVLVLICDMLKGIIAVALVNHFFHSPELDVVTALGALVGHNYSAFLGFKGGKGILSGFTIALMVDWRIGLLIFLTFAVAYGLTQYVSLGSVLAAAMFGVGFILFYRQQPVVMWTALLLAALVIFMHRGNIQRLLRGEERKTNLFGKGRKQ